MTADIAIGFELRITVVGAQPPSLVLQNFCSLIWSHFYIPIRYLIWQKKGHNLESEKSLLFPNLAIEFCQSWQDTKTSCAEITNGKILFRR